MLDGGPKQSELRWHPLRREYAVYAKGRQNRTFKPSTADDPLSPTQQNGSATEIPFSDFELAIFENRFPSFNQHSTTTIPPPNGVQAQPAKGHCDVVVYTPDHKGSLATLSQSRRELLVHAWIDRYQDLFKDGAKYVLPFENRGEEVGVTLPHPHGQIYAFPVIPQPQQNAARSFQDGYDLAKQIQNWRDTYAISEEEGIAAFAPPFARFPYEIWLAPTTKRNHLFEFSDNEISGFAKQLGEITRRYDKFFDRETTPYMLSLHAAPNDGGQHENWHFTAQFYPLLRAQDKVKYLASVEQATGLFTVDVMPEETAKIFRSI